MRRVFGLNMKLYILILAIALIGLGFYWFQWQPSETRKSCAEEATKKSGYMGPNNYYRLCLTKHGMKPESLFIAQ